MHKYITLRGCPENIRRIIHDLQQIYYPYINKKTGKKVALLQLMPREIKTYEVVFPETAKKHIKKDIMEAITKHNTNNTGGCSIHWGPWKKDKWSKEGLELI